MALGTSLSNPNLVAGLQAFASELPGGAGSRAVVALSKRLERGEPFDKAIASPEVHLPAHLKAVLTAAVDAGGGALGQTLERFAAIERGSLELRRQVRLSLLYPACLFGMLFVLFLFYEYFCIAPITDMYQDFRLHAVGAIPNSTQAILALAHPAALWAYGAAAGTVVLLMLIRQRFSLPLLDRGLAHLPLLGPLWRWMALARFSRTLALLLDLRLPLPQALEAAAASLRDSDLAGGCRGAAVRAEQGEPLSQAVAARQFPATLVPILAWGERRGALVEALETSGDLFEGRVRQQQLLIDLFVPPLAFLLVAGGVLFLIYAAYSPLFQILQWLS